MLLPRSPFGHLYFRKGGEGVFFGWRCLSDCNLALKNFQGLTLPPAAAAAVGLLQVSCGAAGPALTGPVQAVAAGNGASATAAAS